MPNRNDSNFQQQIDTFQNVYSRIVGQIQSVIVGHGDVIDHVLTCLFSGGHALLEGVPGLGKTLLIRTLAETLDLSFHRIQFTPDLMPADITGTTVFAADPAGDRTFRFEPGPIFSHLVLADEINRATPKTQSAVLEAMQEQTVSVANTTHALPQPFFLMATQNPIELEGTYPLPEAQLDRFLLKINVTSPSAEQLITILDRTVTAETPTAKKTADASKLLAMRETVRQVPIADNVRHYIARLTLATHPGNDHATAMAQQYVRYGASPRGAQAIALAAKVAALRDGRVNVAFSDVRAVTAPALRHRLILNFEGQADDITTDAVIDDVLDVITPNA